MDNSQLQRRRLIKAFGASLVLFNTGTIAKVASEASKTSLTNKKIVWVVLRGAMDSINTLVPTFDRNLSSLRPTIHQKIKDELLMLDKGYGLHPSLKNFHQWYQNKQLLPIVAVGSGYDSRSHFDGQDYLESGLSEINHDSGWLGRMANISNKNAVALARSKPVTLRDKNGRNTSTWFPSSLKEADDDIYHSLMKMYQDDELLLSRLKKGMEINDMVSMGSSKKRKLGKFVNLAKSCAKLMVGETGLDCAMLEMGGWDTHNNQHFRLSRQLSELDNGLLALKNGLGEEWQNTVVMVATEFGRTAKENGTGGTDHGTASAMFLAGGAIKGGRVLGQWPGLAKEQLFEQRDLMPTTNSISWVKTVLAQHFGLSNAALRHVFPDNISYQESIII